MLLKFEIEIEVQHVSGMFAGKDEVEESIMSDLESADPGSVSNIGANGDSEYEVVSFDVSSVEVPRRRRR